MLAIDTDLKFPTESEHQALLQCKHQVLLCLLPLLSDGNEGLSTFPDVNGQQDTYSEVNRANKDCVEVEKREVRGELRHSSEYQGLPNLLGSRDWLGNGAAYVVLVRESLLDLLYKVQGFGLYALLVRLELNGGLLNDADVGAADLDAEGLLLLVLILSREHLFRVRECSRGLTRLHAPLVELVLVRREDHKVDVEFARRSY